MVQRRPLIINSTASQIQELTDSDSLIGNGTIPLGGIIMWSGGNTIPTGFTLCNAANAGTVNGITVPNLEDKFIIGAKEYSSGWKTNVTGSLGASGGDKDAVLISHSHTLSGGGDNDDVGDNVPASDNTGVHSSTSTVGFDAAGNSSTSQTGTNANLPPYFALAFIIRTT